MSARNEKDRQLGMPLGTASARLRKKLMFMLVCECGQNQCLRCGEEMTENDISIDHKQDWLHSDDPLGLFMDVGNVGFSHMACNRKESRFGWPERVKSPSGFKGVYLIKSGPKKGRWRAMVSFEGKRHFAGYYPTAKEAAAGHDKKVVELGSNSATNEELGLRQIRPVGRAILISGAR